MNTKKKPVKAWAIVDKRSSEICAVGLRRKDVEGDGGNYVVRLVLITLKVETKKKKKRT